MNISGWLGIQEKGCFMEIILYAMPDSKSGQRLEAELRTLTRQITVARFYTLQRFIQRLVEHNPDFRIIIVVLERPKEFIALNSLFHNGLTANLIVVCDDARETIELAHELRPRFLARSDEVAQIKAVVEKMLGKARSSQEGAKS
jgi:hypothetical protein